MSGVSIFKLNRIHPELRLFAVAFWHLNVFDDQLKKHEHEMNVHQQTFLYMTMRY